MTAVDYLAEPVPARHIILEALLADLPPGPCPACRLETLRHSPGLAALEPDPEARETLYWSFWRVQAGLEESPSCLTP